ncbi:hypothetical protein BgiMline_027027, partial [Biomphalaria glabrata]
FKNNLNQYGHPHDTLAPYLTYQTHQHQTHQLIPTTAPNTAAPNTSADTNHSTKHIS